MLFGEKNRHVEPDFEFKSGPNDAYRITGLHLADFLRELRDPAQSGERHSIETLNRCAIGDRAVWLFRYPALNAAGSADIVFRAGRISHVFWQFVASGVGASDADSGLRRIEPGPNTGPPFSGITFAAVVVAIAGLVSTWYRLKDKHQPGSTRDPQKANSKPCVDAKIIPSLRHVKKRPDLCASRASPTSEPQSLALRTDDVRL
jgi:hypothetical protein